MRGKPGAILLCASLAAWGCIVNPAEDAAADGGSAAPAPTPPSACAPAPGDFSAGYDPCGASLPEPEKHRPDDPPCARERAAPPFEVHHEWVDHAECERHADCDEGDNGRCDSFTHSGGTSYFCTYDSCFSDDECGGGVCDCGENTAYGQNKCLDAGDCRVNADCGPGGWCSPSASPDRCDGETEAVG